MIQRMERKIKKLRKKLEKYVAKRILGEFVFNIDVSTAFIWFDWMASVNQRATQQIKLNAQMERANKPGTTGTFSTFTMSHFKTIPTLRWTKSCLFRKSSKEQQKIVCGMRLDIALGANKIHMWFTKLFGWNEINVWLRFVVTIGWYATSLSHDVHLYLLSLICRAIMRQSSFVCDKFRYWWNKNDGKSFAFVEFFFGFPHEYRFIYNSSHCFK